MTVCEKTEIGPKAKRCFALHATLRISFTGVMKRTLNLVVFPFNCAAVATGAKSFKDNPVLGSPYLNQMGLHVRRVRLAERMADARRRRLERLASKDLRDAFAEQGYVKIENAIPNEVFSGLLEEIKTTKFPARELKQGNAVTRFITLSPEVLRSVPNLKKAVRSDEFQGPMRYVASFDADPLVSLHTVLTNPDHGHPDPQTTFHSDTFHATSKGWLFLRDVEQEDGPFSYVPGSHRMTAERLEWEYEQSLSAHDHRDIFHSLGSFRATTDDLSVMGYGQAISFPVKANTLVVADTHGFHARSRSLRKSTRLAI
ncbi:MAG: phytanoyl-CoA dioxygenase family protein, partial [Pseudomonadota bacterium]